MVVLIICWIICIFLLVLGIHGLISCLKEGNEVFSPILFFLLLFCGVILMIDLCGGFKEKNPQPKAIDVYRGKTTLRMTYQDSIPLDTVVVWKKEFEPIKKK